MPHAFLTHLRDYRCDGCAWMSAVHRVDWAALLFVGAANRLNEWWMEKPTICASEFLELYKNKLILKSYTHKNDFLGNHISMQM